MELLYICDLKGKWLDFIYTFPQLLPGLVAGALVRYVLCGVAPRHRCQLSIIRFVPKYLHQLVNFSASPAGDWQTGSLWWAVVESWFLVALKLNFALKNYSMEFFLCPITGRMNVLITGEMDMTPLQVSCWRGKFLRWTQSGIPSTIIYTRWSSRRYELGCDAPVHSLSCQKTGLFTWAILKNTLKYKVNSHMKKLPNPCLLWKHTMKC